MDLRVDTQDTGESPTSLSKSKPYFNEDFQRGYNAGFRKAMRIIQDAAKKEYQKFSKVKNNGN